MNVNSSQSRHSQSRFQFLPDDGIVVDEECSEINDNKPKSLYESQRGS